MTVKIIFWVLSWNRMITVPAGAGTDLSDFLAVTARLLLEIVGEGEGGL
jgi:hypothetical protein